MAAITAGSGRLASCAEQYRTTETFAQLTYRESLVKRASAVSMRRPNFTQAGFPRFEELAPMPFDYDALDFGSHQGTFRTSGKVGGDGSHTSTLLPHLR